MGKQQERAPAGSGKGTKKRRSGRSSAQPLDLQVNIIYDAERTPEWDALWRLLLRPLPSERGAKTDEQDKTDTR